MLPNQQRCTRMAFHVEEAERLLRLGADALVHRVAAIVGYAVHAQEPAVLTIDQHQLTGFVLQLRIAGRHIVAHRLDRAGCAHVEVGFLAGDRILREQHAAVRLARNVL